MDGWIPNDLAVVMFLQYENGWFEDIIAALRTIEDDDMAWEEVTANES